MSCPENVKKFDNSGRYSSSHDCHQTRCHSGRDLAGQLRLAAPNVIPFSRRMLPIFARSGEGIAPQGGAEYRVVDEKWTARLCGDARHEKGGGAQLTRQKATNPPKRVCCLGQSVYLLIQAVCLLLRRDATPIRAKAVAISKSMPGSGTFTLETVRVELLILSLTLLTEKKMLPLTGLVRTVE